ncbi:MAG: hypothetical protein FWE47_04695 [Oscillospiraceae bacterium]|nr:hypothetical protein [Oscillospiraceae bacterium]
MDEHVTKILNNREAFEKTLAPFREGFNELEVFEQNAAVKGLFDCLQKTFQAKAKDTQGKFDEWFKTAGIEPVSEGKDIELRNKFLRTTLGQDTPYYCKGGFIEWPSSFARKFPGPAVAGAMLHEYKHVIDYFIDGKDDSVFVAGDMGHDAANHEVDATKFAMSVMKEFGFDEKQFHRYEAWQKAFNVLERKNEIERNGPYGDMSGKALANNFLKLYGNSEVYKDICQSMAMDSASGQGVRALLTSGIARVAKGVGKRELLYKYFEFEKAIKRHPDFDSEPILQGVREHFAEQGIKIRKRHVKSKGLIKAMVRSRFVIRKAWWKKVRQPRQNIMNKSV